MSAGAVVAIMLVIVVFAFCAYVGYQMGRWG
jgi:hypothetical protein